MADPLDSLSSGPLGLVLTGGTIGSEVAGSEVRLRGGQGDAPSELGSLLGDESLDVRVSQPLWKLSENVLPADWVTIAEAAAELVDRHAVSGVVVLHGTDTAAYTAAALTFLTAGLGVPVVVTGSNVPASAPGSDAATNVRDAVVAAGNLGAGAYLSFSGTPGEPSLVFPGTDVRKVAATGQAFGSAKGPPVASVSGGRFVRQSGAVEKSDSGAYPRRVDDRVLGIKLYPGVDLGLLAGAAIHQGVRGVVVELYPTGTGPTVPGSSSVPDFARRCDENGLVVVATASELPPEQASVYETFADIKDSGALFDGALIFESAIAKLMWSLAQEDSASRVKDLMLKHSPQNNPGTYNAED